MDYDNLITGSFNYAKDGLVGHWIKWIVLIILSLLPAIPLILGIVSGFIALMTAPELLMPIGIITVIFAIILALPYMGYMVQIYRGEDPAPEVKHLGTLFADGFRLFIVYLIYAIPLIVIAAVLLGSAIWALIHAGPQSMADPGNMMGLFGTIILGLIVMLIVGFIIWLALATAIVRFARTGSIGKAFNFGEILSHIGKIGTGSYILALIIMALIVGVVTFILGIIPYAGSVIFIIIGPFIAIFQARYLSLLYDHASGPEQPDNPVEITA